ncbi:MAG: uridine kinase [Bryobacterales bacterium]|jgi:uridine kinase|nr:uridine kinase [Bryobacterales bacterium]
MTHAPETPQEPETPTVAEGSTLLVIGIAGASGSGKSCLAQGVAAALEAPILALDAYYRDLAHLPLEERARQNFDHPDALDWTLLSRHLQQLRRGEAAPVPCYDFASHTRAVRTSLLRARHVLVVEGILALHQPEIRQQMALRVFVDLDSEECLRRRMERDIRERGRTRACVLRQYQETVRPMDLQFVQPSAALADVRVRGDAALDGLIASVVSAARARMASAALA